MARPFQNVVYLRIRRGWLGIQVLTFAGRMLEWSGPAEVVFARNGKGQEQTFAVDDSAQHSCLDHRHFVAFSHPRVIVSDFDRTASVLRTYLRKAGWKKSFLTQTFIFHILEELEGGLSDLEMRAMIEMGRQVGASKCLIIHSPNELSVPNVLRVGRQRHSLSEIPLAVEP